MIEVTSLRVMSFDLDHLDIVWELANTELEHDQFRFWVLRSIDGAGGPYEELTGPMWNTFRIRDPEVNRLHKWRNYYYKVRVKDMTTGDIEEFGPAFLQAPPDLISLDMQRREQLVFSEFNGRKVLVYPELTTGFRCRHCWDVGPKGNYLGRQRMQNCASCFDVSFVGGFTTPMIAHVQIDPAPSHVQRTDTSERAPVDTSARLSAFPPLKPKDMLIEAENIRWQVEKVSTTRKLRSVVRQELILHEIPKSDIRFKVPVNVDAFETDWSPSREFTRPMTMGNDPRTVVPDKVPNDS
jgi:hypothetical protein